MKKYKLIKKYPNGPELNSIVSSNDTDNLQLYPEFWEEILESKVDKVVDTHNLDYPYVSYVYTKQENGNWILGNKQASPSTQIEFTIMDSEIGCDKRFKPYVEEMEKWSILKISKKGVIKSIQRTIDGEIFNLGDRLIGTFAHNDGLVIINEFKISNDNTINVIHDSGVIPNICKDTRIKVSNPIFKTEDGLDVYMGEEVYPVAITYVTGFEPFSIITKKWKVTNNLTVDDGFKYFKSIEAAKEFIIYNTPLLSLKDIENILSNTIKDDKRILFLKTLKDALNSPIKDKLMITINKINKNHE